MRKALARIFAILAIGACAAAVYGVVHSNLLKNDDSSAKTTATTGKHVKHHKHTPYTIKQGDVLSKIAERHHVTVAQIEKLNPHLQAGQLHAGQRIQLR